VRTFGTVVVTAVVTAAFTSAFWLQQFGGTRRPAPEPQAAPQAELTVPGPRAPVIVPPPAPGTPLSPQNEVQSPPPNARIGTIPEDLRAKHLSMPVSGIAVAALTPQFYDARGERGHEALDIIAAQGQPVLAVEDGTIAKLFTSVPGGITIYQFDPTQTYSYYYAHLERYADGLKEGDNVTRGQVIGYVGMTGNAGSPHLHFAIFQLGPEKKWYEGEALDPYPALTAH
jgi:murein DD-endopeptidase MepM/ murein hydrolase activator NlpD